MGACTVALRPLHDRIAAHVLAAERLHGDDTLELARQPAARSGRIGRDLRLALPHRKCAATKLSPKYPAAFGGCLHFYSVPYQYVGKEVDVR